MAEILTIVEAAAYIGCKPATLRAWKAQCRGPRYYRAGRLIRYRRTDLDQWIIDQLAVPRRVTQDVEKVQPENSNPAILHATVPSDITTGRNWSTNSRAESLRRRQRAQS